MKAWGIAGETPGDGEWPARAPVKTDDYEAEDMAETLMLAAAHKALTEIMGCSLSSFILLTIYRAMHAVAPVPLVSDAEIALTKERDQLRARNAVLERTIADYADADAARINAAGLAALSLKPVVPVPEVFDPIANAIRAHETDRRMVGR